MLLNVFSLYICYPHCGLYICPSVSLNKIFHNNHISYVSIQRILVRGKPAWKKYEKFKFCGKKGKEERKMGVICLKHGVRGLKIASFWKIPKLGGMVRSNVGCREETASIPQLPGPPVLIKSTTINLYLDWRGNHHWWGSRNFLSGSFSLAGSDLNSKLKKKKMYKIYTLLQVGFGSGEKKIRIRQAKNYRIRSNPVPYHWYML